MIPDLKLLAIASALLVGMGCTTTVPDFYTKSGQHVGDAEPVKYRIAILPFQGVNQGTANGELRFGYTNSKAFGAKVIENLKIFNTATGVSAVADEAEAKAKNFDLVIRPNIKGRTGLGHTGYPPAGTTVAAGAWVLTWLGGLFVQDCTYSAGVAVDYAVINPYDSSKVLDVKAECASVDLSFFERNEAWSGNFFLTMLLPPQWTYDNPAVTSASISDRAVAHVAARLVKDVKDRLADEISSRYGTLKLVGLKNGSRVTTNRIQLDAELTSRFAIRGVTLHVNNVRQSLRGFKDTGATAKTVGGKRVYAQVIKHSINLKPGGNLIRITATFNGKPLRRTIRVIAP